MIFNCQQSAEKRGFGGEQLLIIYLCGCCVNISYLPNVVGSVEATGILGTLLHSLRLISSAVRHRLFATPRALYLHISISWRLFTSASCKINLMRKFHWTRSVWSADESGCQHAPIYAVNKKSRQNDFFCYLLATNLPLFDVLWRNRFVFRFQQLSSILVSLFL